MWSDEELLALGIEAAPKTESVKNVAVLQTIKLPAPLRPSEDGGSRLQTPEERAFGVLLASLEPRPMVWYRDKAARNQAGCERNSHCAVSESPKDPTTT